MERTKKEEGKIRWRKEGGGSFRMANNKIIKPGQVFEAFESEIPEAFRDNIIPLTPVPAKEEVPVKPVPPEYTLKHRSGGFYWIVDSNGKVMNDEAYKKDEAEQFIKDLGGE